MNAILGIEQMWKSYRDACYKDKDIPRQQEVETRQAFFSGALAAAGIFMQAVDQLPEEEAVKVLSRFMAELTRLIDERMAELRARQ